MRTRAAVLTVVLVAEALVGAQQRPREAPRTGEPYTAATTAILVDVVVRDKRGRPVTDLTKEDFEIYENDVPQTVGSFSVVVARQRHRHPGHADVLPGTTTVATSRARGRDRADAKTDEKPPTTAMVFDSLTPEALSLAQSAALAELPMSGDVARAASASSPPSRACGCCSRIPAISPWCASAVRRVTAAGTLARRRRGANGARRSTTGSGSSTRCPARSASRRPRRSAPAQQQLDARPVHRRGADGQHGDADDPQLRDHRPRSPRVRHRQRVDDGHPVADGVAGTQDHRLFLGRPSGVARRCRPSSTPW